MEGYIDTSKIGGLFFLQRVIYTELALLADSDGAVCTAKANDLFKRLEIGKEAASNILGILESRGMVTRKTRKLFVNGMTQKESVQPGIEVSEADFDIWWKSYGKAISKDACKKAWAKLGKNERRLCMEATPRYVESTPDKKYRKNPLTYLHQKSWNDEIITRNGNNQGLNDAQSRRIRGYAEVAASFRRQSSGDEIRSEE